MQSRFKQYLAKAINEEFVDSDIMGSTYANVYKNPKTLQDMQEWMRGVVLKSGDLYVFDAEEVERHNVLIHADAIKWMNKKLGLNSGYGEGDNPLDYINQFITVDRSEDSDIFVLAESYDLDEVAELADEFRPYLKNFKIKNPNLDLVIFEDDPYFDKRNRS
jgi:hypothetical protein